jgi:hypothetical protein
MTLLEALCADAQVVASDIPAHHEICMRWGAGRVQLIPASSGPSDVAEAIRRAADAPAAGTAPLAYPNWDEVTERTLSVYASVFKEPSSYGRR